MNNSFYTAGVTAMEQQTKLDILSNNIANINTTGYKTKNAVFSELMQYNLNAPKGEPTDFSTGVGAKVQKTDTIFSDGAVLQTGRSLDFAINGDGFFAVKNPETDEISYTRDGSFIMSRYGDKFLLCTANGDQVLDKNEKEITLKSPTDDLDIGVFLFKSTNGMQSDKNNKFKPIGKNGEPVAVKDTEGILMRKALEGSNVDLSAELTKVIEAHRAYQYSLKVVTVSDEIEKTVNSLR